MAAQDPNSGAATFPKHAKPNQSRCSFENSRVPNLSQLPSGKARLLMPMSYAALISGMLTLIATPPNLVVSDELVAQGYQPLGLFSFFLIGALVLLVAVVFILFWGRHRLRSVTDTQEEDLATTGTTLAGMWRSFDLHVQSEILVVAKKVPAEDVAELIGDESNIVIRLRSGAKGKFIPAMFRNGMELLRGDRVFVRGPEESLKTLAQRPEFSERIDPANKIDTWIDEIGFSDVLVHPESPLIGRAVSNGLGVEAKDVEVVALVRDGEPVEDITGTTLQSGDRVLIVGPWDALDRAVKRHDSLVLLSFPQERQSIPPAASGFWAAIIIMAGMIAATLFELVSITAAVLTAAVAAVVFRTLSAEDAYRAVKLPSLVLIAGMLPLADALQVTGGSDLIVEQLLHLVGDASPRAVMSAIFVLTALLGLVLSNMASAVLVAPIAISAAEALRISPYPVALCVLIATSASFSTPISTPVVTLVVAPGGYSFSDFLKLGVPLTILTGIAAVAIAPILFPY